MPTIDLRKLLSKSRLIARRSRVATALLAAQLSIAGAALVVNVFSARALGPEGRGELALHLQVCYILSTLVILGRDVSFLVRLSDNSMFDRVRLAMDRILLLPLGLSIVCAVLAALFFGDDLQSRVLLSISYASMLAGSVFVRSDRSVAIVSGQARVFLVEVLAVQFTLIVVAGAFFVTATSGTSWWFLAYGGTSLVPFIIYRSLKWRPGRGVDKFVVDSATKRLGLRLLPSRISDIIVLRLDRLLLPALSTYGELGIYVVAATMTEVSSLPLRQYVDSATPRWAAEFRNGTLWTWKIVMSAGAITAVTASVAGGLAFVLVVPLFGENYGSSRALIAPLALAAGCYALSRVGTALCLIAGLARWTTWISGSGMLVGVASYIYFIPKWGSMGAAVGTLVAYAACLVVSIVACFRVAHLSRVGRP